jgi:hypothetical protein
MVNDIPTPQGFSGTPQRWAHDWHPLDSYLNLHHTYMTALEDQGLVLNNHLSITNTTSNGALIAVTIEGIIECSGDVFVKVDKLLEARKLDGGQVQVKGKYYSYHAWLNLRPARDLVRYCTAHHGLDGLHQHVFDLETGQEIGKPLIQPVELPTLGDFIPYAVELGRTAKVKG